MKKHPDHLRLNRLLGAAGLATLDDPRGFVAQMGYLVEDHEHFRQLINKCEPAERVNMYNAMKPHLRFAAKPLDVYIAELGDLAERKQLPTIGEGGVLIEFKTPEVRTPEVKDETAIAQAAMAEALANFHLDVVCSQCTRAAEFPGVTKDEAIQAARAAGWKHNRALDREICPQCST